ncbi:MAG: 4-hydroxy-tetrahydrodipicolinate synthase [Planctomycetota bacterium]
MLKGTYTALVTPFADGQVDYDRLAKNIDFQIEAGLDGVVPVGTTGESPTLSHAEHQQVIERTVAAADGRCQVIAGTGSNNTTEALSLTKHAAEAGATMALMVNPYYNKPSQEGLYRHFMTVADAVDLPICLYNIPGRTNVTMAADTVVRLNQHPNIVALKDATGSLDLCSEIISECDIAVISGDDSLTLPLMAVGGVGVISVLSNLLPARVKALVDAAAGGDFAQAKKLHLDLFSLCKGCLTLATNPIPIKAAMQLAGTDTGELRLPLTELEDDGRAKLQTLLEDVLPTHTGTA